MTSQPPKEQVDDEHELIVDHIVPAEELWDKRDMSEPLTCSSGARRSFSLLEIHLPPNIPSDMELLTAASDELTCRDMSTGTAATCFAKGHAHTHVSAAVCKIIIRPAGGIHEFSCPAFPGGRLPPSTRGWGISCSVCLPASAPAATGLSCLPTPRPSC